MQDKIKKQFLQYTDLKVLFFFDGSGAYESAVEPWGLETIALVKGHDRYFSLKYELEIERKAERVFLYFPFARPKGEAWEDFPLLGLYYANRELQLDEAGQFIEKYKLQPHHLPLVKQYIKELQTKKRQQQLATILNAGDFTVVNVERGLIAGALGFTHIPERTLCLAKLFILAQQPAELEKSLQRIDRLKLTKVLCQWVNRSFDKKYEQLSLAKVTQLATIFKYNIILGEYSNTVDTDTYQKYRITASTVLSLLKTLHTDWVNYKQLSEALPIVFNTVAKDIDAGLMVFWYGADHEFGYYTDKMLIAGWQEAFNQVEVNPIKMVALLERWLPKVENNDLKQYFEVGIFGAKALDAMQLYSSYVFNTLDIYIEKYSTELWQVDYFYRKAMVRVTQLGAVSEKLIQKTEALTDLLHQRYDRFLIDLNKAWLNLLAEQDFDYSTISADKQYNFHKNHVKHFEHKMAVIISDGFRFEAAHELHDKLIKDNNKVVEITPMLASIPSYTNLGMTNLLPHNRIESRLNEKKGDFDFKIEGIPTNSISNRSQILKTFDRSSEAIRYDEIVKLGKEAGRALFKENRMVYIYHDEIDETGDSYKSQSRTLRAVDSTLRDIQSLLRKLFNWNVYHVFVTADHGFIYNERKISEASKEHVQKSKDLIKAHTRFLLGQPNSKKLLKYQLGINQTTDLDLDYTVHLPNSINRLKTPGSTRQYVHGGGSLQELVVPVIKYYRKKERFIDEPVEVLLMNKKTLKISSGTLVLKFLQKLAVSNDLKAATYSMGLYDTMGELLSNEPTILFSSIGKTPSERMKQVVLKLNTAGSKQKYCYLQIFDIDRDINKLNPIIRERLNNNQTLMEIDDF